MIVSSGDLLLFLLDVVLILSMLLLVVSTGAVDDDDTDDDADDSIGSDAVVDGSSPDADFLLFPSIITMVGVGSDPVTVEEKDAGQFFSRGREELLVLVGRR